MIKNMLKTIFRRFTELIFNDWIIEKFVTLYKRVLEDKVRKAVGNVALKGITHQGKNCKFQGDVKVYYSEGLELGDDIRIGFGGFLFALDKNIATLDEISQSKCNGGISTLIPFKESGISIKSSSFNFVIKFLILSK